MSEIDQCARPAHHPYRQGIAATVLCLAVSLGSTGVASPPHMEREAPTGRWALQSNPAPYMAVSLEAITCPSITVCYAVGINQQQLAAGGTTTSAIFGTTNGGRSWVALAHGLPASLYSIACTSLTTCYALSSNDTLSPNDTNGPYHNAFFVTTDGGRTWRQVAAPVLLSALFAIACPTPTTCYVAGGSFGGAWPGEGRPHILITHDGGASWTDDAVPATADAARAGNVLGSIACPSPTDCVAVGYDGDGRAPYAVGTTDGGETWAMLPLHGLIPQTVTCPSTTRCLVVGTSSSDDGAYVIAGTTDGGQTWTVLDSSQGTLRAIDCPSVEVCYAVGPGPQVYQGVVRVTNDGGRTWTSQAIPASTVSDTPYHSISCPSITVCYAVGGGGIAATTGGVAPPTKTIVVFVQGVGTTLTRGQGPARCASEQADGTFAKIKTLLHDTFHLDMNSQLLDFSYGATILRNGQTASGRIDVATGDWCPMPYTRDQAGGSLADAEPLLVEMLQDLHRYYAARGQNTQFILIGHSKGGVVAFDVAQAHPELSIALVVTIDSPLLGIGLSAPVVSGIFPVPEPTNKIAYISTDLTIRILLMKFLNVSNVFLSEMDARWHSYQAQPTLLPLQLRVHLEHNGTHLLTLSNRDDVPIPLGSAVFPGGYSYDVMKQAEYIALLRYKYSQIPACAIAVCAMVESLVLEDVANGKSPLQVLDDAAVKAAIDLHGALLDQPTFEPVRMQQAPGLSAIETMNPSYVRITEAVAAVLAH